MSQTPSHAAQLEAVKNLKLPAATAITQNLTSWFQPSERQLPWRVLWEKHRNPYHIWVSEIMLQQTTITAVLSVYQRFLQNYPTIHALAAASEEDVRLAVRGLGYYRRFSLLHRAAKHVVHELDGTLPTNYTDWLKLPGVGDYTASAISSICFREPKPVVDGNVERVLCRLLDIRLPSNLPALKPHYKAWAQQILNQDEPGDFNQALMELGQTLCRPSSPECGTCPLQKHCRAYKNNTQDLAPGPKIKAQKVAVELHLLLQQYDDQLGLSLRPEEQKFLKNTWGFTMLTEKPTKVEHIGLIKHNITNHVISAHVWLQSVRAKKEDQRRWYPLNAIEEKLVSNLDRKALNAYLKWLTKNRVAPNH